MLPNYPLPASHAPSCIHVRYGQNDIYGEGKHLPTADPKLNSHTQIIVIVLYHRTIPKQSKGDYIAKTSQVKMATTFIFGPTGGGLAYF